MRRGNHEDTREGEMESSEILMNEAPKSWGLDLGVCLTCKHHLGLITTKQEHHHCIIMHCVLDRDDRGKDIGPTKYCTQWELNGE